MSETSLRPTISELESLFSKMNTKFYDGVLEPPTITVAPKGRRNCSGWCTTRKVWRNKNDQEGGYVEINLCAEYLQNSFENLATTLLHEMAHLYNVQMGIKDCSRSGKYHNKRFKEAAEKHGLIVKKDERYGFCHTELNDEAREFLWTIDPIVIKLSRELVSKEKNKSQQQNNRKYVCPRCGNIARAAKGVGIICKFCRIEFVENM